ncbi:hypothetical protein ABIA35_006322 [Catenulispora sp. MAP12-49]|uniref:DOMON-like domain-containing protein n=1 Tax=Catenulispora sp. MAP12-49 TaxID=3156302 RepID=UPI0035120224
MPSRVPRNAPLAPFAPSTANAARALNVHLQETSHGSLSLRYVLDADLSQIRIPATRTPRQADELWEHTCFEAFIRTTADSPAYYELNVSPSTEWALYKFDDYHLNMTPITPDRAPRISVTRDAHRLELEVDLDILSPGPTPTPTPTQTGALALAAVVEDADGELDYWALNHPAPNPDFHHRDSFIISA